MSCIHHPDKAYVFVDGQLICPECGRHSPYQPVPSYDQILAENKALKQRIATLEKDIEYLDEKFPKGKTKFRGEAMVLLAMARQQGKIEIKKDFLKFLKLLNKTKSNNKIGQLIDREMTKLQEKKK